MSTGTDRQRLDGRREGLRRKAALLVLAASLFAAAPAHARPKNAHERALALFKESKAHYESGDFAGAANLLKQAYALEPSPVLSFDMGRAYESAGDLKEAIGAYRTYLKTDPHAKDRGAVLHRIDVLEHQLREQKRLAEERNEAAAARARLAEQQRQARARHSTPAPAAPAGSGGAGWVPWLVVGAGGACLIAGGVFGFLAKQRHDDASNASSARAADDAQRTAQTFATIANVGFVAGAVLAAGGVTWLLVTPKKRQGGELAVTVGPGAVRLGGRF